MIRTAPLQRRGALVGTLETRVEKDQRRQRATAPGGRGLVQIDLEGISCERRASGRSRPSISPASFSTCSRASSSREAARSSSISISRISWFAGELIGEDLHRTRRPASSCPSAFIRSRYSIRFRLASMTHVLAGVELGELAGRSAVRPGIDPEDLAAEGDGVVEEPLLGVEVGRPLVGPDRRRRCR